MNLVEYLEPKSKMIFKITYAFTIIPESSFDKEAV